MCHVHTLTHTQADEHTLLLTPFEEGSLFRSFGDRRRIKHVDMRIMLSRALLHLHTHTHKHSQSDGQTQIWIHACIHNIYIYAVCMYVCIYNYGNKLLQCHLALSMVVSPGLECKCSAQSKLIPGDNPWTGHPFEPAEMECYLQFQSKHWIYLPQIKPNLGILQRENDRERQRERGVSHCLSSVRVSSVSLLGIYLVCSSLLAAVVESIIPSFPSTSSPPALITMLPACLTVLQSPLAMATT